MDGMKAVVATAAIGAIGVVVVAASLSSIGASGFAFVGLTVPDKPTDGRSTTGQPLRLSALDGEAPTAALGYATPQLRALVVKVPEDWLDDAADATGQPTARWAVAHPHQPGMMLVAYNAQSTHLGCTVQPGPDFHLAERDGVPFLRLMDVCHHGQWNALAMAKPVPGTPAPNPLGVVPLRFGLGSDAQLLAGPSLDQDRAFDAAHVPTVNLR